MLSDRQLKILTLILNKKYSGNELAELLNSSRRTIVRDMSIIEYWLNQENIGTIDNKNGYTIVTNNSEKINELLSSSENEKFEILYLLLTHDYVTKDDLQDALHITSNELITYIDNLNDSYSNILNINSKLSKGYYVDEALSHKIDLLTSLISVKDELKLRALRETSYSDNDNIQYGGLTHRQSQLLKITCLLINPEIDFRNKLNEVMNNKQEQVKKLSHYKIMKILSEVNQKYHLVFNSHELSDKLYGHLERNIMFLTYFQDNIYDQIQILKLNNPFVFDFSKDLSIQFEKQLINNYINYEYIALYMIENQNSIHNKVTNLALIESKYSIANINNMLINDQIKNINLEIIHRKDELVNLSKDSLLIAAEDELDKFEIRGKTAYVYKGILENNDIESINKIINQFSIEKNMENYFGPNNTCYARNESSKFFDALKIGIDYFKDEELLSHDEGNQLFQRELEGNQLIINHISIPHITSKELDDDYCLLYIQLEHIVKVDGENIYGILMTIVNQNISEHTQMFSFLYNKISKMKIEPKYSYQDFIDNM